MPHRLRRSHVALRACIAVGVLTAACEFSESRRRRASPAGEGREALPDAAASGRPELPPETVAGVVRSAPVDLGTSQCPGARVLRVDRRMAAGIDAGTSAPPPLYFGLDQYGRVMPVMELLACELRAMYFTVKGLAEGMNLIMLRGPHIDNPEGDCEWREPWRSERYGVGDGGLGGRRVWLHERCRRRAGSPASERTVLIDIPQSYLPIRIVTARGP